MRQRRYLPFARALALLVGVSGNVRAQPAPGSASVAPAAPAVPSVAVTPPSEPAPAEGACVEKLPAGKKRPVVEESFPSRGLSGHALPLVVSIEHGAAETVLPTGFRFQPDTPEAKRLKKAGFMLPDPQGGAGPQVERKADAEVPNSKVTISFVALPDKPGRHLLTLPPVPITVARASGDLVTVCTQPHNIVIEEPTSSTPNPKPKRNPPPRRQEEEWTALKHAVGIALIALVVGALLAYLIDRYRKRPRPVPPPPPPRPPWEVALEALHDLRHAGLTREGRYAEHFDRVSDIVRRYLGDRYGFDGLESTTREMLGELRRTTPRIVVLDEIERFLRQADLVKFAGLKPGEPECANALSEAGVIVERTMPLPMPAGVVEQQTDEKPTAEDDDG